MLFPAFTCAYVRYSHRRYPLALKREAESIMKTLKITGQVDQNGQLRASVPPEVTAGAIELVLLLPEEDDDEFSETWMKFVCKEWAAELADPREDIYTLEDGEPIDGHR